jgi:hypothetical protein
MGELYIQEKKPEARSEKPEARSQKMNHRCSVFPSGF